MDRLGVIRRGKTVLLFELSREVVNAGEAKHVADLGDRTVVFLNQKLCVIQLEVGDVLFRTDVQVGRKRFCREERETENLMHRSSIVNAEQMLLLM